MIFFSKDVDFNDIALELDKIMVKKIVPLINRQDLKGDEMLAKEFETLLKKIGKLRIATHNGEPVFTFEPQYCFSTAETFRRGGHFLDAIAWYLMSCTRECDFSSPYTSIAGLLKEAQKYKSAMTVYKFADGLFPKDFKVSIRMAILLYFHIEDKSFDGSDFVKELKEAEKSLGSYEAVKDMVKMLYSRQYNLDSFFHDYEVRAGY